LLSLLLLWTNFVKAATPPSSCLPALSRPYSISIEQLHLFLTQLEA